MDFESVYERIQAQIDDLNEDNAVQRLNRIKEIANEALSEMSSESSASVICEWCRNNASDSITLEADGRDDTILCRSCHNDMPQYLRDNVAHFIGAWEDDCLPNGIPKMDGSLKRFAKGVFEFLSNDDEECCIAFYESLDVYKRHLENGDTEDWNRESVFSDGKKIRVETSFTVEPE